MSWVIMVQESDKTTKYAHPKSANFRAGNPQPCRAEVGRPQNFVIGTTNFVIGTTKFVIRTSGQASPNLAEQRLRDYKLLSLGLQTLLMRLQIFVIGLQILSLDYKLCYWTTKLCL